MQQAGLMLQIMPPFPPPYLITHTHTHAQSVLCGAEGIRAGGDGNSEEKVFCPHTLVQLPVSAPINSH